jgi:hypothetical protein
MTVVLKAVIVNTTGIVLFWLAYRGGWVGSAIANDIAYIVPGIFVMFIAGQFACFASREWVDLLADTMIRCGFAGTLMGVFVAFTGITADAIGNANAAGEVLAILLHGLGGALFTTLAGLFFSSWLYILQHVTDD